MLSSETLFHFTNSLEKLKGILRNEFYPHYSLEKYPLDPKKEPSILAIPMVSFCDIPLSEVKEHVKIYGYYGIGMSKNWAEKKGLNPVLYLYKGSDLAIGIEEMLISAANMQTLIEEEEKKRRTVLISLLNMFRYIKPFKGDFIRNGKLRKNYKFYNEREWRYIPDLKKYYALTEEAFQDLKKHKEKDEKLKVTKLTFEPKDIKYIIIKNEEEISGMVEALQHIKSKYDPHTVKILTTRIISYKQIKEDV